MFAIWKQDHFYKGFEAENFVEDLSEIPYVIEKLSNI